MEENTIPKDITAIITIQKDIIFITNLRQNYQ